jgi:hypothetical protein
MQWELSTWAKHVQRSSIEKNGTESDKAAVGGSKNGFSKLACRASRLYIEHQAGLESRKTAIKLHRSAQ